MAKYYFLFILIYSVSSLHAQKCDWRDLLRIPAEWSGDTERILTTPSGWQLNDDQARNTELVWKSEKSATLFQLSFSLDFPPSPNNRLEVVVGFRDSLNQDAGSLHLVVGESGDQDGVQLTYHQNEKLIGKSTIWRGLYGAGADRSTWFLTISKTVLSIQNESEDSLYQLPWETESPVRIHAILIRCTYTKSRSTGFVFHHVNVGTGSETGILRIVPGDIFISEYRIPQNSSGCFIELYNSFMNPVCVTGLRILLDGLIFELPPILFIPGDYTLIADSTSVWAAEGIAVPIHEFVDKEGSFSEIRLFHLNDLIHVVYLPEDGGNYSWEMIDITKPCRTDNWLQSATVDGTPGKENGWFSTLDSGSVSFHWKNSQTGILSYPSLVLGQNGFAPSIASNHAFAIKIREEKSLVEIYFKNGFTRADSLVLRIIADYQGCGGSGISLDTTIVEKPPNRGRKYGLLFTELMYDPPAGCPEYLEISNLEGERVVWDQLILQRSGASPIPLNVPVEWSANESRVLTAAGSGFKKCYQEVRNESVFVVPRFSLPNRGGHLILAAVDPVNRIVDEASYGPYDHNEIFSNPKGIALERNIFIPERNKWRSGFVQFGHRSPGFVPEWELEPRVEVIFSSSTIFTTPGRSPSELEITLKTPGVGGSVTIEIFDLHGHKIQTLADAIPVQGGETFIWKGSEETGLLLPEGLYLFWIYYFDMEGHKRIIKKTCVLSNN
ncbi:hypothetical protein KUV50_04855 [Membranicola marinus]|uniref:FlgD Ig-like domain-containing protein n=1 Tax=Membranihabitans marinus TaxID=1227546 RepID=A0A953HLT8_9BACT|nr:hypothetical protein [Membranihabitans marinus]MBY5957454.1 hypothetical protein [Membranihabitans marinus]